MGKQCCIIPAVHQFQHLITTALQRDMEMRHERTGVRTVVYQFIRQQVGFQTADTEPLDALHLIECLHQIQTRLTGCPTEITNVDTRQHDFLSPFLCRLFCLCHQRSDAGIAGEAASVWYRAIGTEIVAAILHFQEIARAVTTRT